jgi:GNAT superfamily N-acetyltransferase
VFAFKTRILEAAATGDAIHKEKSFMGYEMKFTSVAFRSRWRETLGRWVIAGLQYAARTVAARGELAWNQTPSRRPCEYRIRKAYPLEFSPLGELIVNVYGSLPGMPGVIEQPDYYEVLRDVARRVNNPAISVFVATSERGDLIGSVDFISDMKQYGARGAASTISNAAGIRYLAVKSDFRGNGIGRSLTAFCVDRARELGKSAVILHTTRPMATAWAMYTRMGFQRYPEIDFQQGNLEVFGFRLGLDPVRWSAPKKAFASNGG